MTEEYRRRLWHQSVEPNWSACSLHCETQWAYLPRLSKARFAANTGYNSTTGLQETFGDAEIAWGKVNDSGRSQRGELGQNPMTTEEVSS
jgi:hypothetical protein